jgi:hypothetical protein
MVALAVYQKLVALAVYQKLMEWNFDNDNDALE